MPESGQWLGHFGSNRNGMSAETNLNLDWFKFKKVAGDTNDNYR